MKEKLVKRLSLDPAPTFSLLCIPSRDPSPLDDIFGGRHSSMLSVGTLSELSFGLLKANSILQEPNNLFMLETHISSSTVFAQQSPKPSGQEFALTISPFLDDC